MVGSYFSTKMPCTNWTVRADLPTPPDPSTTILYSRILDTETNKAKLVAQAKKDRLIFLCKMGKLAKTKRKRKKAYLVDSPQASWRISSKKRINILNQPYYIQWKLSCIFYFYLHEIVWKEDFSVMYIFWKQCVCVMLFVLCSHWVHITSNFNSNFLSLVCDSVANRSFHLSI